jgi:AraC-like DNA-binding protein
MTKIRRPGVGQNPQLVPLPEAGAHAFMVSQYKEPAFHFLWHYHTEMELVWIRKGSGLRYVGRSVERFESGDLVLLGSGLPHTWASAPNQSSKAEWSVIQFLPKHWSDEFWKLPEVNKLNKLFVQAARGMQFIGPTTSQIGDLIEELSSVPTHTLEGLIQFLTIFERLLQTPFRLLNTVHASMGSIEKDPRVEHLLAWIQSHFAEPITQAQAAAQVKMSPAAFSRWFKLRVGRVFQHYLNELRVAKVCGQLTESEENITEVAYRCGYNNLANFNRRFREITGLTPTKFRSQTKHTQEQNARNFLVRLGANSAVRISPRASLKKLPAI